MTTAARTRPPCLDDVSTGDALPELVYAVDQELIDRFGMASLDLNPVHMDPGWSARAQVFGMPATVAHGMMSMSFMTSLVLRAFGAAADVMSVDSTFTKPVPVGATVTCRGEVRDLHLVGGGDDHAVIAVTAVDQAGDTVGVAKVAVRLPRRSQR